MFAYVFERVLEELGEISLGLLIERIQILFGNFCDRVGGVVHGAADFRDRVVGSFIHGAADCTPHRRNEGRSRVDGRRHRKLKSTLDNDKRRYTEGFFIA